MNKELAFFNIVAYSSRDQIVGTLSGITSSQYKALRFGTELIVNNQISTPLYEKGFLRQYKQFIGKFLTSPHQLSSNILKKNWHPISSLARVLLHNYETRNKSSTHLKERIRPLSAKKNKEPQSNQGRSTSSEFTSGNKTESYAAESYADENQFSSTEEDDDEDEQSCQTESYEYDADNEEETQTSAEEEEDDEENGRFERKSD